LNINIVAWKAEIRKSGGMKLLVPYLEAQDPDIKKNVTYAISLLLEDSNFTFFFFFFFFFL